MYVLVRITAAVATAAALVAPALAPTPTLALPTATPAPTPTSDDVGEILAAAATEIIAALNEPLHIVQLGDSYGSGNGAGDYTDDFCFRSPNAAIEIVGDELDAEVTNAACNAAWIGHLAGPQRISSSPWYTITFDVPEGTAATDAINLPAAAQAATAAGACDNLNAPGLPEARPDFQFSDSAVTGTTATARVRCRLSLPPQVEVLDDQVDVVVITMGGNDLGFIPVILSCFVLHQENECREATGQARAALDETMAAYADALGEVQAAAPNAELYLVGYPRVLAPDHYRIGNYDAGADINAFQTEWQEQLRALAGDGVTVVELESWEGHGLNPRFGADNRDSWIHPPLSLSGGLEERFHPTAEGARGTAQDLLKYLEVE